MINNIQKIVVFTEANKFYKMHIKFNPTLKSHYLYCCTVHFEDSLNITHQQMH